jgi:hypothetical protein
MFPDVSLQSVFPDPSYCIQEHARASKFEVEARLLPTRRIRGKRKERLDIFPYRYVLFHYGKSSYNV